MFTPAERSRLKRDIADILEDHGLPAYLKVNWLVDLFEDRCLAGGLQIPDLDAFRDDRPPPESLPAKKKSARNKAAAKKTARRKHVNAQSTDASP